MAENQVRSLTRRQHEDEESRKAERNRAVFEAWLEKKREERKKEHALKIKALQREEEEWERKRGRGQIAFDRWLKKKQAEDIVAKKERSKEIELRKLRNEELRERRHRSETAFSTWKNFKDIEWETERELTRRMNRSLSPSRREPTPSLPGYCSVWSCDQDMAQHFVSRVKRFGSLDLSKAHTYTDNTTHNYDHTHTSHITPSPPYNVNYSRN